MKDKIFFEKFSKKNEIERRKANRDNCSKTKRKNERKTRHSKKSTKQTKNHTILRSKISRDQTQNFFFLLTKRRKNTNTDTNSETLRRLTIIVTVLAKSYFSTDDIAEFIDKSNKRKRRILTQVSEIFTKLSKR